LNEKIRLNKLEEIRPAVNKIIQDIMLNAALSDECAFNIKLVLNEMLGNGFIHGGEYPECTVLYRISDGEIKFSIYDSGKGCRQNKFFLNNLKAAGSDGICENGRGVFLANCISDGLRYNMKGNVVLGKIIFKTNN